LAIEKLLSNFSTGNTQLVTGNQHSQLAPGTQHPTSQPRNFFSLKKKFLQTDGKKGASSFYT
jgi:hypothetical protein